MGDAIRLDAASLYELEDGRLRKDASGRWTAEEAGRELRLSFRWRSPGGEALRRGLRRLGAGEPISPWVPGSAQLTGLPGEMGRALLRGELRPELVLAGLVLALGLGVLGGRAGLSLLRGGLRGRPRGPRRPLVRLAASLPALGALVLVLLAFGAQRLGLGIALGLAALLGTALRLLTEPLDRGTSVQ